MTLQLRFNPLSGSFDYVDISSASGQATPTIVASGVTFTISADTQMLFLAPCKLDGTIVIDGTRVNLG